MSRYEKRLEEMRAAQDAVGRREPSREPMSHGDIESFLKGFGLSAPALRQITDRWTADATAQYRSGYESGAEDLGWGQS